MRFILEKCKLIHLGKTNPKHSMGKHSAEHRGGLPPSGPLRRPSQEIDLSLDTGFFTNPAIKDILGTTGQFEHGHIRKQQ